MARLFISCNHKDFEAGKQLERALEQRGHVMTVRVDARPGGRWEEQLLHALHRTDAFIALLTENGVSSSHSADSLQTDLNGAEIVMGLIGKDTADSDYLLFELGASWGLRKPTLPLRIAGATFKHVPEVLRERSSLTLEDVTQCLQLVEDVGRISSLTRKVESTPTIEAMHRQAEKLADAAKTPGART